MVIWVQEPEAMLIINFSLFQGNIDQVAPSFLFFLRSLYVKIELEAFLFLPAVYTTCCNQDKNITDLVLQQQLALGDGRPRKKWGSMIRVVWEAHLHRQRLLQKLVQMEAKILHPRVFRFFHTCLPSCFPFCRKSRLSPTALEPQYTFIRTVKCISIWKSNNIV